MNKKEIMKKEKIVTVSDIISHLHKIANPGLAYDWDNVGLQIGNLEQDVKKILLTLDVTNNAVEKAINEKADLIISHHPIIYKPIKKITNPLYLRLIQNNISVYCAHTNLDVIKKGVNFALAEKMGLNNLKFLSTETGAKLYHVAVYVPQDSMIEVAKAIFKAGAGTIGNYKNCLNDYEVSGQFKPMAGSDPILGKQDKLEKVVERKLEFFVDSFNLQKVISVMKKVHPYETPAYAVYPQERHSENYGLGLIGNLKNKLTLRNFAELVKKNLNAPFAKLWLADKKQNTIISKVAICGGSGSSLLQQVYGRADVFVSADFSYHIMLDSKIPLIDAGHFYTENPVLKNLEKILVGFDIEIIHLKADEHEIKDQIII